MNEKIKVGIIGAGRIGKIHAENIIKNFINVEIKAVADIFADGIREWAEDLRIPKVYADYMEVLSDREIEAVLVCSSTNTHSTVSIEAAQAGKHVFCEKPIDFDLDRIHGVRDAVAKAGVKYQVGFNRRFDHNFKAVKDAIMQGKIGEVQTIKVTSRDPQPPSIDYIKVSGGLFLDMTIHDFDMVRYLTDSEVIEVYANAGTLVDPAIGEAGDFDTALIQLKFANGALGVIDNSRKAVYGYDQRVEVFGSKGGIAISNDSPSTAVLSTADGIVSEKPKYFFLERYKDSFIAELQEFFNNIKNDEEPLVTVNDGLKSVLIALAAKKSAEEGRPIKVEL